MNDFARRPDGPSVAEEEAQSQFSRLLVREQQHAITSLRNAFIEWSDAQSNTSEWDAEEREQPLTQGQRGILVEPLRWILRKSGRVWSAEVECNGLSWDTLAGRAGMDTGNYSTRPDRPRVIVTSDSTVDAEIKISCMRDGSPEHQRLARNTYEVLLQHEMFAATNAGHHVHVDATRLADLGFEKCVLAVDAAATFGRFTAEALKALSSSGYGAHRFGETENGWYEGDRTLAHRSNLHGERLGHAARDESGQNATVEYRLPNATLEPIRAHAHIAIAMALLDLGERATIDGDTAAEHALKSAKEQLGHAQRLTEEQGASFLAEFLQLSADSFSALAVASATSPASTKHRKIWRQLAPTIPNSILAS